MSRSMYPRPFYFGATPQEREARFHGNAIQAKCDPPSDYPGRVQVQEGCYSGTGARSSEVGRGQQLPMTIPDWPVQNPNPFGTIDSGDK